MSANESCNDGRCSLQVVSRLRQLGLVTQSAAAWYCFLCYSLHLSTENGQAEFTWIAAYTDGTSGCKRFICFYYFCVLGVKQSYSIVSQSVGDAQSCSCSDYPPVHSAKLPCIASIHYLICGCSLFVFNTLSTVHVDRLHQCVILSYSVPNLCFHFFFKFQHVCVNMCYNVIVWFDVDISPRACCSAYLCFCNYTQTLGIDCCLFIYFLYVSIIIIIFYQANTVATTVVLHYNFCSTALLILYIFIIITVSIIVCLCYVMNSTVLLLLQYNH